MAQSPPTGVTESERYLASLCEKAFLSLWSYPNVYRAQRAGATGDGKEVADLVVVFGNDVLIFSDKTVAFNDAKGLELGWSRWYRAAVVDGARQLFGAERWLRDNPELIFVDCACTDPLPVTLPPPERARYHRVVVVHGAAEQCRRVHGGSGSLMTTNEPAPGDAPPPFTISPPFPEKGFVHVVDETVLDILLGQLDTVADLVAYFRAKEGLFQSDVKVVAAGEEELLGFYLGKLGPDGRHGFDLGPEPPDMIAFMEGHWEGFMGSPERSAQAKADEISYAWDDLAEAFIKHIVAKTQYTATTREIAVIEQVPRWMARESRTRRRMLARKLVDMVTNPVPKFRASYLLPSDPGDPYWVFVVMPEKNWTGTHDEYRQDRVSRIQAYCYVVKHLHPEAEHIVGIAVNPVSDGGGSEDSLYLDAREWPAETAELARSLHEEHGLLRKVDRTVGNEKEYPMPPATSSPKPLAVSKVGRNEPCPCGSGKKFKKCCLGR